jgi:hypothetical protein
MHLGRLYSAIELGEETFVILEEGLFAEEVSG